MNRWMRNWSVTVGFWVLFLVSLGLEGRYGWIDTVWYVALLALMLLMSGYSLVRMIRHRHEADFASYRGMPFWLARLLDPDLPAARFRE
jgi:steroid 5-alpha reductase family enzyme